MAKTRRSRTQFMDEFMAEPITLAGFPAVVMTRHEMYRFYVDRCGMDPYSRGFGSAEYMAFGRKAEDAPLTDLSQPWVMRALDTIAEHARGL